MDYVRRIRDFLSHGAAHNLYITPRATLYGAALLENGVPAADVVNAVLLAGCGEELKRNIKAKVGEFKP